jgi:hypothetical protein
MSSLLLNDGQICGWLLVVAVAGCCRLVPVIRYGIGLVRPVLTASPIACRSSCVRPAITAASNRASVFQYVSGFEGRPRGGLSGDHRQLSFWRCVVGKLEAVQYSISCGITVEELVGAPD